MYSTTDHPLQACIDHIEYLEDCVAKLQARNSDTGAISTSGQISFPRPASPESSSSSRQDHISHEDVEMGDPESSSPAYSTHVLSPQAAACPTLRTQDCCGSQELCSSASTDQHGYDFNDSTPTSPTPRPEAHSSARPTTAPGISVLSPALLSQTNLDQEALAALLMLNANRRCDHGSVIRTGISVRDLLE
jgi:hypothetical protein